MKKTISVLLTAILLFSLCSVCFAEEAEKKLTFNEGKFKILVFSDTQDDQNPAYDMLNLLSLAIEETKPDLIVFTGDLTEDSRIGDLGIDDEPFREGVEVNDNYEKTLENVKAAAGAVLDIFQESGVPFALTQGNNDHNCAKNEDWLQIYSQYSNCLVKDESPDKDGRIDYNLPVYGSDGSMIFNLWMLDTGRGGLSAESLSWYNSECADITAANNGTPVPAMAFQHIHTPDVGNLFIECTPFDTGAKASGTKFYKLDRTKATGSNFFAYPPCEPSEEFKAFKANGDVIGAYFGHQHVEGFTGTVDGIELGFNYGAEMAKIGPYGYRLITLHEDDILNFDNEIQVYKGSVKLNTAHFELQEEKEEKNLGFFIQFLRYIKNFAVSLISIVVDLVA